MHLSILLGLMSVMVASINIFEVTAQTRIPGGKFPISVDDPIALQAKDFVEKYHKQPIKVITAEEQVVAGFAVYLDYFIIPTDQHCKAAVLFPVGTGVRFAIDGIPDCTLE